MSLTWDLLPNTGSCDRHENKKKEKKIVYDSIWATWHQWGRSQGLLTFTICIMF